MGGHQLSPLLCNTWCSPRARCMTLCLVCVVSFIVALQLGRREDWLYYPQLLTKGGPAYGLVNGDVSDEQARIGKVAILYGGDKPVYERALRTHKMHNRLHGYPMFIQREGVLDGLWTKPAHVLTMLLRELGKPKNQRLLWLFWIDADTIILNYKTPLEAFLPPENDDELKDLHLLATNDWNGLNNGIFAIRVCPYAVELFAGILAFRNFRPGTALKYQDQSAMELLLRERKYAKHAVTVPQRWFNAYPGTDGERLQSYQVRPGDLLVHFPGMANREVPMAKWCDVSEQEDSAWNLALSRTDYPQELARFWKEWKDKKKNIGRHWREGKRQLQSVIRYATQATEQLQHKATSKDIKVVQQSRDDAIRMIQMREHVEDADMVFGDLTELEAAMARLEKALGYLLDR